jgi:ATP-dependent protease Clp ATPase subunit
MTETKNATPRCTFCGKDTKDLAVLIAAPEGSAYICDECIVTCLGILQERAVNAVKVVKAKQAEKPA